MKFLKNIRKQKKKPLPFVSLPHHYAIKKMQERWFFAFLLFFLFSAWYTYNYSKFKVEQNRLVPVVVASKNLEAPGTINENDLKILHFAKKDLPDVFFENPEDLLNKTFLRDLVKNQIILPHDMHFKSDPESISSHFDSLFAFSIDESWLSSRLPEVRKNDKIDIVVSNPKESQDQSTVIAQQIKVLDVQLGADKKKTLIVNITKKEAQAILFSQGLRLPMQVLVYPSTIQKILPKSMPKIIENNNE